MTGEDDDASTDDGGASGRQGGNETIAAVAGGLDAGPPRVNAPAANDEAILIRIKALEEQHADLHLAIEALSEKVGRDDLAVARLKKRKLMLKDAIATLRDQLTPDIIA